MDICIFPSKMFSWLKKKHFWKCLFFLLATCSFHHLLTCLKVFPPSRAPSTSPPPPLSFSWSLICLLVYFLDINFILSFYHLPFLVPLCLNLYYLWPLLYFLRGPVRKESLQEFPRCLHIHCLSISVPWPLGDPLCPAQHPQSEVPRGR